MTSPTDRERAERLAAEYRHCFQVDRLGDELAKDIEAELSAVRREAERQAIERAAVVAHNFESTAPYRVIGPQGISGYSATVAYAAINIAKAIRALLPPTPTTPEGKEQTR